MKVAKPKRASHTYTQQLAASWKEVFPLLCPVREADWLDGWDPVSVASSSGFAERDCVFVTSAGAGRAIWYITRHEPETGCIEMIKITPDVTACRLEIQVGPAAQGAQAKITYTHTSLGPAGDALVDGFTADFYLQFMKNWESRLSHYLRTGQAWRDAAT